MSNCSIVLRKSFNEKLRESGFRISTTNAGNQTPIKEEKKFNQMLTSFLRQFQMWHKNIFSHICGTKKNYFQMWHNKKCLMWHPRKCPYVAPKKLIYISGTKKTKIFFASCRAYDFLGRSAQIFSFILRSCHILIACKQAGQNSDVWQLNQK